MTDSNIYRIIEAFREGKKVVRRSQYTSPATYLSFADISGLLRGLAGHKDEDHRWFIDGIEVKDE